MDSCGNRVHWNSVSGYWDLLGPPLRPSPEDIAIIRDAVLRLAVRSPQRAYRVIQWGVTPELALMDWPEGTELLAIDRAEEMIATVWPGDVPGFRRAVQGEWSDSPRFAGDACDLIVGDGSLNSTRYPSEFGELTHAARDSLRPEGLVIMRLHAAPEVREEPEAVVEDLLERKIGSFHAFKLRFAMALQASPQAGIEIGRIWEAWRSFGIDEGELAESTGWDARVIGAIHLYRDKQGKYFFPTLDQHLAIFRETLRLLEVRIPGYEIGDRRPIVVLARGD